MVLFTLRVVPDLAELMIAADLDRVGRPALLLAEMVGMVEAQALFSLSVRAL